MLTLAQARANKMKLSFAVMPRRCVEIHRSPRVQKRRSGLLANYIDWGPFFQTWDLAGPFPRF
jgi:5-methyltetrahydrofolate--homocysteine methyltransferase